MMSKAVFAFFVSAALARAVLTIGGVEAIQEPAPYSVEVAR